MRANRQTGMTIDSIKKVFQSMIPHAVTIDETTATVDVVCKKCNTNHTISLDKERYISSGKQEHVFKKCFLKLI